ncbi:MAG: HAMP domain-containing sensor histidine kinase [Eubacterium sp.]|jgi:signal transduction histidine kinase|nr:HAMP domain-containing sensor histidine kinase [Eubacterium sp.]
MQRSVLDRIYIAFLLILIVSFGFLIFFISYFTRRSLISEKQITLSNEATLISSQTITYYMAGAMSTSDLATSFNYYAGTLKADIWYVNAKGELIASSGYFGETKDGETGTSSDSKTSVAIMKSLPKSIYDLDKNYQLNENSYSVSDFYGTYSDKVITVNTPVVLTVQDSDGNGSQNLNCGALIIHTTTEDINNMMKKIYSISFIPCLVIIVISFALLQIVSHKVLRPIKKLAEVAQDYSKGDFDVETGIKSSDEIGQLADSMEYMASELSKLEEYRHDFISNISHDFRSPLTSIRGYVTAIQDGTIPPEKQERYLGIVLDETNRLTKLTQGLLDLNRLEIYGPYLNLVDFDFIDIVKTTLNTFEIKCIDKKVAIYLNNHAEATVVTADKTKIQQVLYNLIDNALKFTPSNKNIYINITEKGEKLHVSVKDEGIGMSEDTQKKIWTRFYKNDTSRGKDKGGTGLGLAITKQIIKAHNETIDVYSTEGEGSEFVFTLTKANEESTHSGETQILINPNNTL